MNVVFFLAGIVALVCTLLRGLYLLIRHEPMPSKSNKPPKKSGVQLEMKQTLALYVLARRRGRPRSVGDPPTELAGAFSGPGRGRKPNVVGPRGLAFSGSHFQRAHAHSERTPYLIGVPWISA